MNSTTYSFAEHFRVILQYEDSIGSTLRGGEGGKERRKRGGGEGERERNSEGKRGGGDREGNEEASRIRRSVGKQRKEEKNNKTEEIRGDRGE